MTAREAAGEAPAAYRPRAMSAIDELLEHARAREAGFDKGDLPRTPARGVAVVACMDARLDLHAILGLAEGDAHVIRNAGAAITDDVVRSLAVSQRLLGTTEVMVIDHTGCGMLEVSDEALRGALEE